MKKSAKVRECESAKVDRGSLLHARICVLPYFRTFALSHS